MNKHGNRLLNPVVFVLERFLLGVCVRKSLDLSLPSNKLISSQRRIVVSTKKKVTASKKSNRNNEC